MLSPEKAVGLAGPSVQRVNIGISGCSTSPGLPVRFRVFGILLGTEFLLLSALPHPMVDALSLGPALLIFGVVLVSLGRKRFTVPLVDDASFSKVFGGLHALLFLTVITTQWVLPRANGNAGNTGLLGEGPWLALLLLLIVTSMAALFPTRAHRRMLETFGTAWLYAAAAAVAVVFGARLLRMTWNLPNLWLGAALQKATFTGVVYLLRLFYTGVMINTANATVGTAKFQVIVSGRCSGIEGLALMLVLAVSWLIYARRELRMSRAIWLVPVALLTAAALNMVRIAVLVAIGDSGHGDVAIHGFHSEAGWLLFNAVGFAFMLAADRLQWFRKDAGDAAKTLTERNAASTYLLPFLAVLAASMIGRATSSGFDWLYPLRPVAALAALLWLHKEYRRGGDTRIDWRFGWLGPVAGVAVFAMWFALARWQHTDGSVLAGQLQALAPWQRWIWIVARAMAAVITVPIAEELAFRGYIARRVMSADVEAVPLASLSAVAIVVSSLLFGLMHGRMWLAGTLAGLVFAGVAKLRGRLGEAVAAHAVANLLIAVWVLVSGDFGMW